MTEKSEEVARLSKQVADLLSGGDAFCHMAIGNFDNVNNLGLVSFLHEGKSPLYGLKARFENWQKNKEVKEVTPLNFRLLLGDTLEVGDLPEGSIVLGPLSLGDSDRMNFNIAFSARNGFFHQTLLLRKVNGQWYSASRVVRNRETIFEKVDMEFPRNSSQCVEWE